MASKENVKSGAVKSFTVWLTPHMHKLLRMHAARHDVGMGEFVRAVLRTHFDEFPLDKFLDKLKDDEDE